MGQGVLQMDILRRTSDSLTTSPFFASRNALSAAEAPGKFMASTCQGDSSWSSVKFNSEIYSFSVDRLVSVDKSMLTSDKNTMSITKKTKTTTKAKPVRTGKKVSDTAKAPVSSSKKTKSNAPAPAGKKRTRRSFPLFVEVKLSVLQDLFKNDPDAMIKVSRNFIIEVKTEGDAEKALKEMGVS